jgi:hypothetical protein
MRDKADKATEVANLQATSQKNTQIIAQIESNVQCLICLEPLLKPYAWVSLPSYARSMTYTFTRSLAPCGHICCLSCLQDWFRADPSGEPEPAQNDARAVMGRPKTCPACRGAVRARPAPVFALKAIAVALASGTQQEDEEVRGDPWQDIFWPERTGALGTEDGDEASDDELDALAMMLDGEDSDEPEVDVNRDDDEEVAEAVAGTVESDEEEGMEWESEYGYGTGSDEEPYEGEWVRPRWAPPFVSYHDHLAAHLTPCSPSLPL